MLSITLTQFIVIISFQGYCHEGECRTYDKQCNELWIGGILKICFLYIYLLESGYVWSSK